MAETGLERVEGEAAFAFRKPILDAIDAYNDAATGMAEPARPLAFLLRDPATQEVTGGLWAISYYRWLFVELLVLPEDQRGQGLGTRLMRAAEEEARARACLGIWLDTFSFQARGFYEKLGFTVFGQIDHYPPGHSRFWMRKSLQESPAPTGG